MSTWRTVMRLEWRILRRERAVLAILGLFALCLVFAALSSGRHAAQLEAGMQRARDGEAARYAQAASRLDTLRRGRRPPQSKDPRNPHYMGGEGAARIAILPPAPLAAMAVGKRDLSAQAVRITSGVELAADRTSETPMIGPSRLATGAFDPSFLFVFLFPLLVIALSYELLTGERERGTLPMLLSQPITQSQLVLGKAGARTLLLLWVTLAFTLAGLAVAGAELSSLDAWIQVGLLAVVLLAWAFFWFAAAIYVNSRSASSANNALTLVGLWLLLVVVVPGLVQVAVDAVAPPPSRVDLLHEVREATQEAEQKLASIEGRHDVDRTANDFAQRVTAMQRQLVVDMRPVLAEMTTRQSERRDLLGHLKFLSPAIVVQLAVEDIAGSGNLRHARFESQVEAFREVYRGFFFERVDRQARLTTRDLDEVPKFTFVEESIAQLSRRALAAALFLFMLAALAVALALPGLRTPGRLAR